STLQRKVVPLVKWRLKRALDYIEANFEAQITLAELAACAGLSRSYFAAQFRATMGVRPREYLLRRRIAHAQKLLSKEAVALVDVALSVVFKTQQHFTGVFRRFTGETPAKWRAMNYAGTAPWPTSARRGTNLHGAQASG